MPAAGNGGGSPRGPSFAALGGAGGGTTGGNSGSGAGAADAGAEAATVGLGNEKSLAAGALAVDVPDAGAAWPTDTPMSAGTTARASRIHQRFGIFMTRPPPPVPG